MKRALLEMNVGFNLPTKHRTPTDPEMKGIFWHKLSQRWGVRVNVLPKGRKCIGYWKELSDAKKARDDYYGLVNNACGAQDLIAVMPPAITQLPEHSLGSQQPDLEVIAELQDQFQNLVCLLHSSTEPPFWRHNPSPDNITFFPSQQEEQPKVQPYHDFTHCDVSFCYSSKMPPRPAYEDKHGFFYPYRVLMEVEIPEEVQNENQEGLEANPSSWDYYVFSI
jgi:hypothetical protein